MHIDIYHYINGERMVLQCGDNTQTMTSRKQIMLVWHTCERTDKYPTEPLFYFLFSFLLTPPNTRTHMHAHTHTHTHTYTVCSVIVHQPVKFSSQPDLPEEECQQLLLQYMPEHVRNTKTMQRLFIKWGYIKWSCFCGNLEEGGRS